MLRAAIYARVSSQMQRDSQTIRSQLDVLPAFIKSQGWRLVETYIDDGKSAKTGKLDRRESYARLMRDAEAKRFDVVVVVDVNRLTRTESIEERAQILGPFQRLGIQVATPSGGVLDLRSFMGEFWVTVQSMVAAEENRKRAEATRRGQSHRARTGGKPRGRTPYGLTYDARTWSLHPEHSKHVAEIYRRVTKGESCGAIAYDFNARGVPAPVESWSPWLVRRIVIARYPVGEWMADIAQRLVIRVPAIVNETIWRRANDALADGRLRGLRRSKHYPLLESIATCKCGKPIVIHRARRSASYYCKGRRKRMPGEVLCGANPARINDIDERVWATVLHEINAPGLGRQLAAKAAARAPVRGDAGKLKADLARMSKAEQTITERFSRGLLSETAFDASLETLRKDRARIEEQLAVTTRAQEPTVDPSAWLFALRELAHSGSAQDRQRVVRAVVKRAILVGERIKLTLRIEAQETAVLAVRSCPRTPNEDNDGRVLEFTVAA